MAIGCVETAEHAAVAALAPVELRGSAFGLLAAVQSFGNLAASASAGLLWTLASPRVAFGYLVAWMALALVGLLLAERRRYSTIGEAIVAAILAAPARLVGEAGTPLTVVSSPGRRATEGRRPQGRQWLMAGTSSRRYAS